MKLKINVWLWAVIIVAGLALIMFGLYIGHFNNGFSTNNSDWGAFGAYFGGIAGLLAFAGVLLSIERASNSNLTNSERDSFFRMLELYTAKFNNVQYDGNSKEYGAEAFKKYTEEADLYLKHVVLYKYILNTLESGKKINDLDNLFYNTYNFMQNQSPITYLINCVENTDNTVDVTPQEILKRLKTKLSKNEIPIIKCNINSLVEIMIKEKPLSLDEIYDYTRIAADAIYDKYGHILGQYFRNLYYVMKTTSALKSEHSEDYKPLLRAQISRYEIALNVYNALSSRSGVSMIGYLEEYKIFKDLYEPDICLFELSNDRNLISDLMNKSNEYLMSIKRI